MCNLGPLHRCSSSCPTAPEISTSPDRTLCAQLTEVNLAGTKGQSLVFLLMARMSTTSETLPLQAIRLRRASGGKICSPARTGELACSSCYREYTIGFLTWWAGTADAKGTSASRTRARLDRTVGGLTRNCMVYLIRSQVCLSCEQMSTDLDRTGPLLQAHKQAVPHKSDASLAIRRGAELPLSRHRGSQRLWRLGTVSARTWADSQRVLAEDL
jgi:hypothetical protein